MALISKSLLPLVLAGLSLSLSGPLSAQNLTDTQWGPIEIAAQRVSEGSKARVQFDANGTVYGNGGCNSFSGTYTTNGDSILIGPLRATMMMCQDPIASMEMAFFRALDGARSFAVQGNVLVLTDAVGNTILKLEPRAAE